MGNNAEQFMTKILRWLAISFVVISVLLLFGVISFILFDRGIVNWFTKIDLTKAALLGSFIGGFIGVFWTATGSLLIFLNLYEQKQQFKKNQFESSFFNLMNFYYEGLKEITGAKEINPPNNDNKGEYRGRRYLRYALDDFRQMLIEQVSILRNRQNELKSIIEGDSPYDPNFGDKIKGLVNVVYAVFFDNKIVQLGHYFRLIYNIVKYIDESDISDLEKNKYVNLIQSQMSDDELGLIFYNGLSKRGEKMFDLLEKYSFLENISKDGIIYSVNKTFYPKTKFKYC